MDLSKQIKDFLKTAERPLIVILGPTASGKTAISLKIAKEIDGEIISTDSRQIYKEMEIGTEAILPKDQEGVPHHMLGIATPAKAISLAEYKDMALEIIDEIYSRNSIPMLVGGTGLYISAIAQDYDVPRIPPNEALRKKLQKEAKEKGNHFLHDKLKKLDPEKAETIHPNNTRYVIRAIEVIKGGGAQIEKTQNPAFDTFMIGIQWDREKLYDRINMRADSQVKRGLLEEVKGLVENKYDENLPSMSSLGVKEIIPYIKGEKPIEECMEILKRNTRRYAKRQMTWFKRYDNVNWLTPEQVEKIVK